MGNDGWLYEKTLGGKAKEFWWKIDEEYNILIKRRFAHQKEPLTQKVTSEEINKLDEYLSDGEWKALSNNVEKLRLGIEKPGIGKFLYDNLKMNETEAQLSSHLGTIFSNSGAWLYNGKEKNMEFKKNTEDWKRLIKEYYDKKLES
jgi:hypothetical protein